jgi:hypothetical protein
MTDSKSLCLSCGRSSDEVALLPLEYKSRSLSVCPQCLPMLIHQPARLEGKLPGASGFPHPGSERH